MLIFYLTRVRIKIRPFLLARSQQADLARLNKENMNLHWRFMPPTPSRAQEVHYLAELPEHEIKYNPPWQPRTEVNMYGYT